MAGTSDLDLFVRDALTRGLSRAEIASVLTNAGWQTEQVAAALGHYADVSFPLPVPRPKAYLSPREAFMYLLMFTTLYISAYQLGSLLFDLINKAFPDPTDVNREFTRETIRWSVSVLIVAFPVFLWMATLISRQVSRDPVKRASSVRKWLTYATLFIAASVLIGDVTALVYYLLSGEIAVRFMLKVAVVAAIAGSCFSYYLWDLRKDEKEVA